jgi:hypothetical protein
MLKFELCYEVGSDAVLLPDLLDVQQPQFDLDLSDSLEFVFEYAYLPKSIMPRFIVRMHRDIFKEKAWRTGVLLSDHLFRAQAVVTADTSAKQIKVIVVGEQRRDYFSVIRKAISEINSSFEKLTVIESVPLPDTPDMLIPYQELVGHEVEGKSQIFVGRLRRSYPVEKLLNGIEKPSFRHAGDVTTVINVGGNYVTNSSVETAGDLSRSRDHSPLLLLIARGTFVIGALLAIMGVAFVALGATGETEFSFFGQTFRSESVGIAALFLGAALIVLNIRRVLKSSDSIRSHDSSPT